MTKSEHEHGNKSSADLSPPIAATNAAMIYVSEKHYDALAKLNFTATASADNFQNRNVAIVIDADPASRKRGEEIAKSIDGVAASVRILDLGDVSNWLKSDPAGAKLAKLAKAAPLWKPDSVDTGSSTNTNSDDDGDDKSDEQLIAELAALGLLQYAKRRKEVAKQLGISVIELDRIVKEARGQTPDKLSERWHVERWPEPVSTNDLLVELTDLYARFVILPEYGAITMALWTLHAWTIDAAYVSPFLMVSSPEMRCGKSTALSLLYWTGPRTALASNISRAAIYQYIEASHPTLLIDEAETFLTANEATRGILNSGHTRDTAFVIRCEGEDHQPKQLSTWAPKALASIGKLAATLRDRAIILRMKRKKRGEQVEKLRGRDTDSFAILRQKCRRWADDNLEALNDAHPALPDDLNDRAADNWEPLLAIADLAGGDYPKLARAAALHLSGDNEIEAQSIGVQLLAAIKALFDTRRVDRIRSETLAAELASDAEGPWSAFGKSGKPITQRQIASLLSRYGIRSDSVRFPDLGATRKGYMRSWFDDAFDTYLDLPPNDPEQRNTRTATGLTCISSSGTEPNVFRIENGENPNNDGPCSGVPDRETPLGQNKEKGAANCSSEPSEPCAESMAQESVDPPRCAQCNAAPDGQERLRTIDGQPVWLHPGRCEQFYRQAQDQPW